MIRYWLFLVLFIFLNVSLTAQVSIQDKKARAKQLIYHSRYDEALAFLQRSKLTEKDEELKFLSGICYYQLNRLDQASTIFNSLVKRDRPAFAEVLLFLGKTYHARHEFSKAANSYKLYLKAIKKDAPARTVVLEDLRRASNGLSLQYKEKKVVVENLGKEVNTPLDEFAPVLSPNFREKLYFSSIREGNQGGRRDSRGLSNETSGQYFSDIYHCTLQNGMWGNPQAFAPPINSLKHEVLLDFNRQGSALIYFQGTNLGKGEIMVDTFKNQSQSGFSSSPFVGPLYAMSGDGTPYFANDTTLFFSSNRPGGYGGADLYKSILRAGQWSKPENLGPAVNSPFEEISPFMANDGKTLYFSSNNSRKSMGGLDIFKSEYNENTQQWSEADNVGVPLNSAGDDAYFRLAKDGYTAFFSSSRKDGLGMRDIYVAYFEEQQKEQIILNNEPEMVYQEDPILPEQAEVEDIPSEALSENQEALSLFFQSEDDFLSDKNKVILDKIASLHQENEDLRIVVTGFSNQEKALPVRLFNAIKSAEAAKNYLEEKGVSEKAIFIRSADIKDFNLLDDPSKYKLVLSLVNLKELDTGLAKFATISSSKSTAEDYNKLLSDQLFYKVQIASVKKPYQNDILEKYSDAMMEKSSVAGYYRCTLGLFSSYTEAKDLKSTLRKEGVKGAFVVPYIFGVRIEKKEANQFSKKLPDLKNYIKG